MYSNYPENRFYFLKYLNYLILRWTELIIFRMYNNYIHYEKLPHTDLDELKFKGTTDSLLNKVFLGFCQYNKIWADLLSVNLQW